MANFNTQLQRSPNAASKIMGMLSQMPKQGINEAAVQKQKLQFEMVKGANETAINLLSRVTSEEDLQIVKRQFAAQYPDFAQKMDQILPSYDANAVRLFQDQLKDATIQIREKELEFNKWGAENKLQGFAPGTAIFKGGEEVGMVPSKPAEPKFDVFESPEGNQVYVKKGDAIPDGYKKVQGRGVTINTGNVARGTRTQLEKDIIEGVKNVKSFQRTEKLFKDEYLTYMGKGTKEVVGILDKAGMSTKGQKKFIKERANWFRRAKADFIAYRKWATGVAGGEKELKEIATSFPDPVKNGPAQYRANLDSIEETTKEILQLNREFLESGIDTEMPLDDIFREMGEKGLSVPLPPNTEIPKKKKKEAQKDIVIKFDSEGNRIEE